MSYCRFSSDNFQSDVYVYADVYGGYTTMVAEVRSGGDDSLVKIGLPHDGETFNDETAEGVLKRLLSLRELGYHVPEVALLRLKKELEDDGIQ